MTSLLVVALLHATAQPEGDWFSQLYTPDGIELKSDESVFTLYALFNAMGYDAAPALRTDPIPKRAFHPVRARVRQQLTLSPALLVAADAFFDQHPLPLGRYLAWAVAPGGNDLTGLDALLQKVRDEGKVRTLFDASQPDARAALRVYIGVLDAPVAKLRKLLKVRDAAPAPTVVVNLLEGQGSARSALAGDRAVVVVGPPERPERPDLEGVLTEYARALVAPTVARPASGWAGGAGLLREARALGAGERTVPEYAAALFARAAALRATDGTPAQYEDASKAGYFGLKEISQQLDDSRPLEAWALEALARAETRRPAKK